MIRANLACHFFQFARASSSATRVGLRFAGRWCSCMCACDRRSTRRGECRGGGRREGDLRSSHGRDRLCGSGRYMRGRSRCSFQLSGVCDDSARGGSGRLYDDVCRCIHRERGRSRSRRRQGRRGIVRIDNFARVGSRLGQLSSRRRRVRGGGGRGGGEGQYDCLSEIVGVRLAAPAAVRVEGLLHLQPATLVAEGAGLCTQHRTTATAFHDEATSASQRECALSVIACWLV